MKKDNTGRNPTTQYRFSEQTMADLDRIAAHFGVESRADAIRIAVRMTARDLPKLTLDREKASNSH